jgi:hypothetical protein
MQEHAYDHANRSRGQEHHGHLPRHDLNETWAKMTDFWGIVLLSTRKKFAEVLEPIAMGGESVQTYSLVGS